MTCADCGNQARPMSEATRMKGNTIREPGEDLCAGCSSRRVLMVREVTALPTDIKRIRAQRLALLQSGA